MCRASRSASQRSTKVLIKANRRRSSGAPVSKARKGTEQSIPASPGVVSDKTGKKPQALRGHAGTDLRSASSPGDNRAEQGSSRGKLKVKTAKSPSAASKEGMTRSPKWSSALSAGVSGNAEQTFANHPSIVKSSPAADV